MKINRTVGILFTAVNCILVILCVVFFLRLDRTAPEFTASASDVIYTRHMDETRLLEGLAAKDNRDGDVTDRIVVEKIMEEEEEGLAVVFYAVSDRSGNVAKFSRQFAAVYEEIENRELGIAGYAAVFEDIGVGEITGREEDKEKEQEPEEAAQQPTPPPTPEPAPTAAPERTPTPKPSEQPRQEEEEPRQAEATGEEQPGGEEQPEGEENSEPEEADGSQPPVMTLRTREVHVKAGVRPAWVDVIGVLSDDKDSYETLFHNLKVSKYDVNTPGTYQVTVSTEDSNGNASAALPLTIVVQ